MPNHPTSIIVAMSGGVDSSVAALLLKQQGHQVAGLFMKNWEEDDTETICAAAQDIADAQAVCDRLDIPLHKVNFAAEYWEQVFTHFLQAYAQGLTPNPDILCNREIKFNLCLTHAKQLGATYFATGHYAQIAQQNQTYQLLKGHDNQKDQSYFIYPLTQTILAQTLFPVGHLAKTAVRTLAAQAKLPTHAKRDSTGICFIGEKRFRRFLSDYLPCQPGLIQTRDGQIIGEHQGVFYYTLGQRQGLGIGGYAKGNGQAWYVIDKMVAQNILIVAQGADAPELLSSTLTCDNLHWIAGIPPTLPLTCTAKIRYRQTEQACRLMPSITKSYPVLFDTPQWAITPGQSIVFYQHNTCLGGGTIVSR